MCPGSKQILNWVKKMKKIFLVESGLWKKDGRDQIRAFGDEEDAWIWCLRRFKTKYMQRKNLDKIKGFRGAFRGRKRWVLITEIPFKPKALKG